MHQYRYRAQRNWGARIHETEQFGMRVVVLENATLRISVLADKGADIIEWCYKPQDLDCVWLSADGVRDPLAALATAPDPTATFIDTYPGGWQEVFPNGGMPARVAGAPYGQHGEICLLPWDYTIVTDSAEEIAVTFSVRTQRAPFFVEKTLRLTRADPCLMVTETIRNESGVALRAMWGHHITFGQPFLTPGCQIHLPAGVRGITQDDALLPNGQQKSSFTWPYAADGQGNTIDLRTLPPQGTPSEMIYLTGFNEGWYALTSSEHQVTVRLNWDATLMPYLWFWREYGITTAYPWYGRHYNIGLEPFSGFPNTGLPDAIANGSALTFAPGETKSLAFAARIAPGIFVADA